MNQSFIIATDDGVTNVEADARMPPPVNKLRGAPRRVAMTTLQRVSNDSFEIYNSVSTQLISIQTITGSAAMPSM